MSLIVMIEKAKMVHAWVGRDYIHETLRLQNLWVHFRLVVILTMPCLRVRLLRAACPPRKRTAACAHPSRAYLVGRM